MSAGLACPGPGEPWLWEDVRDLSQWLAALRRTVPPERWVEDWSGGPPPGMAAMM